MPMDPHEKLKHAHTLALAAWRETVVGIPRGNAEYRAVCEAEAALWRAGIEVGSDADGNPLYGSDVAFADAGSDWFE